MSLVPDYASSDDEPSHSSVSAPAKRKIQIVVDLPKVEFEASVPKKVLKTGSGLFASLPAPKSNLKPTALGGGSKGASITLKPISQKTYQAPLSVSVSGSISKKSQQVEDDSFFSLPEAATCSKVETSVPIKIKSVVHHEIPEEAESASAAYVYPQKEVQGSSTYMYPEADSHASYLPADIDLHELHKLGHKTTEGPIEFIEVNQFQNLQEEREREAAADEFSGKPRASHILPAKDTRKRHTIFSLAAKAKQESTYLEEQRSETKASRKIARAKYGF